MGRGFFITGTDTGVGKTVVTAGLLAALTSAGVDAVAFKPVQSGAVRTERGLLSPDAAFYRLAAGVTEERSEDGCVYCLEPPLSPHLAARLSGIEIDPGRIVRKCMELRSRHQVLLVEGAGGLCVPLTGAEYTVLHLAVELGFPLIVVARPGLGTINHTVLTINCARAAGLRVAGFIISGYPARPGAAEEDNPSVIQVMTGAPLLGLLPYLDGLNVEAGQAAGLAEAAAGHIRWRELLKEE